MVFLLWLIRQTTEHNTVAILLSQHELTIISNGHNKHALSKEIGRPCSLQT